MHSRDHLQSFATGFAFVRRLGLPIFFLGATVLLQPVAAQTAIANADGVSAPQPAMQSTWSSLTKAQQLALSPLAKHWEGLSESQKRKWVAVAKTYPELGPRDQEKLHSRMVDWAALSPRDREQARLNFAQTKTVAKADRAANWEAYQALSQEERKKLADGAKLKPAGAAVAVKPIASDKLAAVPVTRRTPEPERAAAASQKPLNRNTLLPQSSTAAKDSKASGLGLQTNPSNP